MRVHVEFLGTFRLATGTKEITLEMDQGATFRDLVRAVAYRYPPLTEGMIHAEDYTLEESNAINLNGQRMILEHEMDEPLTDGDQITLMAILAGG
jgi:molybdopterin converting factor small subunit